MLIANTLAVWEEYIYFC